MNISKMHNLSKLLMLICLLLAAQHICAQTIGTVTYEYTDEQGTPLEEADVNGNITATFDYTPYGSIALGSSPKGPGYTGHVNDPETSLVYMQARYYDPVTGRFLSIDPDDPSSGNTFSFNRYAYVSNNPIMHVDANGRCFEDFCAAEIAACAAFPACRGAVMATGAALTAIFTVRAVQDTQSATTQNNNSDVPAPTPVAGGAVPQDGAKESQRPSKTPNTGEPGSTYKNPGSGQEREYGEDGKPVKDIDFDHDHEQGRPHVHDWGRDTNGNPVRGPGRDVNPNTEPNTPPTRNSTPLQAPSTSPGNDQNSLPPNVLITNDGAPNDG